MVTSQCLVNSSRECNINSPKWRALSQPNGGSIGAILLIMQLIILVTLTVAVSVVTPATYTDKWDNVDVEPILESSRLLKGYVDCLLDRGKCTPDGKALKETLPDALESECSKCTEKQKTSSDKVIRHLVNKRKDLWKELAMKYDPENKYQERYKDKIEAAKQ